MNRTWNRWAAVLCGALLLFTAACAPPGQNTDTPESQPAAPAESTASQPSESGAAPQPSGSTPPESQEASQTDLFAAVALDNVLAAVVYYPTKEEQELLSVPELPVYDDSDGVYFDEVAIVPQYGDCSIVVDEIAFYEEGGIYVSKPSVFELPAGVDADAAVGGLLIRSMIPEGMPRLQVTVTRGEQSGTYVLGYDGKGDGVYFIREGDEG